jgi:hypothetical protein
MAILWKDCRAQLKPVHQPRHHRDCVGELIQIDGSERWWFERRGPQYTLLVYIDEATNRLMHLQFVESESTFDYFKATRAYLEQHGKPGPPCSASFGGEISTGVGTLLDIQRSSHIAIGADLVRCRRQISVGLQFD